MIPRLAEGIEEVAEQPESGSDQNQRREADQTNAEKLKDRHSRPPIVVCIRHDKPRQREEEIDCEISMFDEGPRAVEAERIIEDVEDHDQECSTTSQPIQYFEVLFSATGAVDNYGNIHRSEISTVPVRLPHVFCSSVNGTKV